MKSRRLSSGYNDVACGKGFGRVLFRDFCKTFSTATTATTATDTTTASGTSTSAASTTALLHSKKCSCPLIKDLKVVGQLNC